MVSRDMIAQLHQDITTAEDAGDRATADRLREELARAQQARDAEPTTDPNEARKEAAQDRRLAHDLGPGSAEVDQSSIGEVPGVVQEPPD
ncbi:hypothetical protein IU449_14375 [Nocardia higoensis]|uniref:Uncharacterized protein n=1 Tax=Nocardia higoensis TaxID=228599 RepID=A0ABS0DB62_9NOCA|nr:hypothetical protein [Nocardia higoensis]MBF6355718.1 hypothetical protein [Nocardia higoensis]